MFVVHSYTYQVFLPHILISMHYKIRLRIPGNKSTSIYVNFLSHKILLQNGSNPNRSTPIEETNTVVINHHQCPRHSPRCHSQRQCPLHGGNLHRALPHPTGTRPHRQNPRRLPLQCRRLEETPSLRDGVLQLLPLLLSHRSRSQTRH